MANTLESVMRLTDQYTATMQKIINSADAYSKTQKSAESVARSFQTSLSGLGSGTSSAANGIGSLALKIGGFITTATLAKKAVSGLFDAIKTGAQQQVQLNTFKALMGNQTLGTDLYNFVSAYAQNSALGRGDLASATTSFLAYTKNVNQIKQLLDLTQRLYMWNPEQGGQGAVFALKEVLGGQTMSLKNRFNINGVSAEKVTSFYNKGDTEGLINYLSQMLNRAGATQEVVDANFKSLTVQAQNFGTNFADAMGNQANPAVQSLTATLMGLNTQMKAGQFQSFFNAVAAGANNLALAGTWLAQNFQTVIPTISAVVGAFAAYKLASEAIRLTTLITTITVGAATQNWIGLAAAIAGAAGAGVLASKLLNSPSSGEATKQMQTAQQAAANLAAEQKRQGASTLGNSAGAGGLGTSVPTKVTNSSPIKVSGTVEIEKENLKYVFEASAAKFFASFNAQKIEPSLTVQKQYVSKTANLDEVDGYLGNLLAGRASASAGGNYK